MRPELSNLLYDRYKSLYMWQRQSQRYSSILCDDGWFSIIDALSKTVLSLAPQCLSHQVGTECSTLNFKCSDRSDGVDQAITAATKYSSLICEITGRRGNLFDNEIGPDKSTWLKVSLASNRMADNLDKKDAAEHLKSDVNINMPRTWPRSEREAWSKEKVNCVLREINDHALTPNCVIDIPATGFDLTHTIIRSIAPRLPGRLLYPGLASLKIRDIRWLDQTGLVVDVDPSSLAAVAKFRFNGAVLVSGITKSKSSLKDEVQRLSLKISAACLFGKNMSERIEWETGHAGPVDDQGNLI